ncbi:MAG: hypothetical protein IPP90_05865 [Gemmatimonadaceae bacterium]|nr:hypothetical protein [Gemmatimonadaceae bacterium]
MAMLLLNVSAVIAVGLARAAARSTQAAQLTTASWALVTHDTESAVAAPCTTAAATAGAVAHPQLYSAWMERAQAGWRERDMDITITPSAFASAAPMRLAARAAWNCP